MKHLLLLAALCACSIHLSAQQLPLLTQYRYHASVLNPAAVSSEFMVFEHPLSFGATIRSQWTDIENAPRTQIVRGDYIWSDGEAFTLLTGGHIMNDQTGPTGFTGIYGKLGGLITDDPYFGGFSAAITVGAVQYRVNGSEIRLREQNDVLANQDYTQIYPDVGLGLYFYRLIESRGLFEDSYVYAGLSIPQVLGLDLEFEGEDGRFNTKRVQHYYAMGGWLKRFNDDAYVEISSWARYTPNVPLNASFNLRYQMAGSLWLGTGYSTANSMHFELGFLLGENIGFYNNFRVGYSLEMSFNDYGPSVGNIHELVLTYSFGN